MQPIDSLVSKTDGRTDGGGEGSISGQRSAASKQIIPSSSESRTGGHSQPVTVRVARPLSGGKPNDVPLRRWDGAIKMSCMASRQAAALGSPRNSSDKTQRQAVQKRLQHRNRTRFCVLLGRCVVGSLPQRGGAFRCSNPSDKPEERLGPF